MLLKSRMQIFKFKKNINKILQHHQKIKQKIKKILKKKPKKNKKNDLSIVF